MGSNPNESSEAQRKIDMSVPHVARIYDFWLGGKDNFEADREVGRKTAEVNPALLEGVRGNRAFLARSVRYLASECGIRQFLDIGTGIPASNNTHEVAQAAAPDSRVVYLDNDPIVLAHARALLKGSDPGQIDYLDADIRNTDKVLDAASATLDFSQPIAVMMIAILHCIPDDDNPLGIVRKLVSAVPSGSYLALSHPGSDFAHPERNSGVEARMNEVMPTKITFRRREQVLAFFDGLDLVEPGLIRVPEWHPDSPEGAANPAEVWGGVARKP